MNKDMTKEEFAPIQNYENTKIAVGYVSRKVATQADYDRVGFMSGLEVHQQLDTGRKLFCHCPSGIYNASEDYDAEIIRHMRPTLSELGEYDGTALMEFKTKKNIIYRIKNESACTYEVDDTPPFAMDRKALEIALEISLISKLNIVGEVHITRKQYLDGSIPTGFQRTAILGVEGEISLRNKKVRLIQLSIEEDSCREISDVGHLRIYKTDRLGMPLIETVTYPDFKNPDEVREGAEYIRFLNRSTGKVRVGIGAGREDVNVSCKGGSRVEIKGVSHNKWIPELTHNEVFRQWALLQIREILKARIENIKNWKTQSTKLDPKTFDFTYKALTKAKKNGFEIWAINLPYFKGILSHFTQPGKIFADEISDRLKVIACIEKPNMIHNEELNKAEADSSFFKIREMLGAGNDDAQLIIWGPEADISTALETIEERCQMAFEGVPNETRKSFEDGTTVFERVLPGADRMYPDTDSAPIPLENEYIEELEKRIPTEVKERYEQLNKWKVPEDTYHYILRNNLVPFIETIINELKINSTFVGTIFGHILKNVEGQFSRSSDFSYGQIFKLLNFLKENSIDLIIAKYMISEIYQHPKMDFESVLTTINFKKIPKEEILSKVPFLKNKFDEIRISSNDDEEVKIRWIMGELRKLALGNIPLSELNEFIRNGN